MDIKLRAVEPEDVDTLFRLECTEDVRRVSWGECPVSRRLLWEYAVSYSADICRDRQLRLVVEYNGNVAGAVDITDYDPCNRRAMIGIAILPEHRERGLGGESLGLCLDYCRKLGLRQVAAMVPMDNIRSLNLFGSFGFKHAGLLRQWLGDTDVALLQLFL